MYVGIDIGASKTLVAVGRGEAKIEQSQKITTPKSPGQALLEIIHVIEELSKGRKLKAVSVVAAGRVDTKKGVIEESPNLGWKDFKIGTALRNHFNVPVRVENDADAAALAEVNLGAAKNHHHVLYITISTGVNAVLVIDGEVYRGSSESEAGHMIINPTGLTCGCGGQGHWEAYISGPAIIRRFGLPAWQLPASKKKIWNEYARDVALGLHNLMTVETPDIVVMGGGVNVHFHKFEKYLLQYLKSMKPMYKIPPIVQAKNIETAPVYGALILASKA